jgi:hypothetical protein
MPKLTIYVPDPLAAALREATMNVSAVCQRALLDELGGQTERADDQPDLLFLLARIEQDVNTVRDDVLTRALALLSADRPT